MEEISRKHEKFMVNRNQTRFQNKELRGESPLRKTSNNQSIISSTTNKSANSKSSAPATPAVNKQRNRPQESTRNNLYNNSSNNLSSAMPFTNNNSTNDINNGAIGNNNNVHRMKTERSNSCIKIVCHQNPICNNPQHNQSTVKQILFYSNIEHILKNDPFA